MELKGRVTAEAVRLSVSAIRRKNGEIGFANLKIERKRNSSERIISYS